MTEIEAKMDWRGWELEICVDDTYFRCSGDDEESAESNAKWLLDRMLDGFSDDETLPIGQQNDICKYACSVARNAGQMMRLLAVMYQNQEEARVIDEKEVRN